MNVASNSFYSLITISSVWQSIECKLLPRSVCVTTSSAFLLSVCVYISAYYWITYTAISLVSRSSVWHSLPLHSTSSVYAWFSTMHASSVIVWFSCVSALMVYVSISLVYMGALFHSMTSLEPVSAILAIIEARNSIWISLRFSYVLKFSKWCIVVVWIYESVEFVEAWMLWSSVFISGLRKLPPAIDLRAMLWVLSRKDLNISPASGSPM